MATMDNKILIRIKGQEQVIDLDEVGVEVILQDDNGNDLTSFDLGGFIDDCVAWEDVLPWEDLMSEV